MRLRSVRPINKVQTAAVSGALAAILIWVLETYAHINMPEYIAAALTTIIMSLVAYITPMLPGELDTVSSGPIVFGNGGTVVAPVVRDDQSRA
jgi:hypothetical protein